jgi:ribosome maturation factor RimP
MACVNIEALLEQTVTGLGYEFAGWERPGSGLLRVYIDKPAGIDVEDCAQVSNHLSRVFSVEGVDYGRLEISSPGLDRMLRNEADFARFKGETARVKLRVPQDGRRNFVGILRTVRDGKLEMDVDDELLELQISNVDKARLVPRI